MAERPEELHLIATIWELLGSRVFDVHVIVGEADHSPQLMAAIEAVIPNCRYRSGYCRGRLKARPLRRILTRLAEEHFTADHRGWWQIKGA